MTRRRGLVARQREAVVGVSFFILAAAVFTIWPQIDLAISAWFYDPGAGFSGQRNPVVMALYRSIPALGWLTGLSCAALLLWSSKRPLAQRWRYRAGLLLAPRRRDRAAMLLAPRWRYRAALLLALLVVGDGLLVNAVLKSHWGRARPSQVSEFGGSARFTPAWQPTDQCQRNCSFVSGHAAAAFSLMALGAMGSAKRRRRWLVLGAAAGLLAGLARISQGGHFASDVVFCGLLMWATLALAREVVLRGRLRRRVGAL
jgi:lipid A 4'-phosphatase